jgi:hypothetical protein
VFWIDLRSQIPIYERIKERVLEMIALGLLRPDDGLPSVRGLAGSWASIPYGAKGLPGAGERKNSVFVLGRGSFVKAERIWPKKCGTGKNPPSKKH